VIAASVVSFVQQTISQAPMQKVVAAAVTALMIVAAAIVTVAIVTVEAAAIYALETVARWLCKPVVSASAAHAYCVSALFPINKNILSEKCLSSSQANYQSCYEKKMSGYFSNHF
jgi:hypothetical protein